MSGVLPATKTIESEPRPLSAAEIQRFQTLEQAFQRVQALPKGSSREEGIRALKKDWGQLRLEAIEGHYAAKTILLALWVNRMIEEFSQPRPGLVHFDDFGFDIARLQLAKRRISEQQFRANRQAAALQGLVSYYRITDPEHKNPLVSHPTALFEPVMRVLKATGHQDTHVWGNILIREHFQDLTPQQQQRYLSLAISKFLHEKSLLPKLTTMTNLARIHKHHPDRPEWTSLNVQVKQRLQQASQHDTTSTPAFWMVFLGLVQDPALPDLLTPFATPKSPKKTQQAVAWSLGRVKTPKAFNMLESMLTNGAFHPLAQEMAMISLAEYHDVYPERVMTLIERFAPLPGRPATGIKHRMVVEEAARAMREQLDKRPRTEPDYYVNKLLTTEQERQAYRVQRDQYVVGWSLLDVAQQNIVDRALLPFRQYLPAILEKKGRHTIVKRMITEAASFQFSIGLRGRDGRLYDSVEGVSSQTSGAVSSLRLIAPGEENVFAHELIHHLHQLVWSQEGKNDIIDALYEQNQPLDYYAATNEKEYLAEAGEALDSLYKSHGTLYPTIFNNGYSSGSDNTRSKLKRIDPATFNFLKSVRSIPLELCTLFPRENTPEDKRLT